MKEQLRPLMLRSQRAIAVAALAAACAAFGVPGARAALPEIRLGAKNAINSCVTPARLMRYVADRNPNLNPVFKELAHLYKKHGEANRVRWDYAFFQMLVETGYLTFRSSPRKMGDVNPRQFNFAGIGTTGGGVPGDRFPDASTGVLAHIQHLVVYSGEVLASPVARRTREVQDDVAKRSQAMRRAVTFTDLTNRWAIDRRYARSIQAVAERFFSGYCNGPADDEPVVASPAPRPAVPAAKLAERPKRGDPAPSSAPAKSHTATDDAPEKAAPAAMAALGPGARPPATPAAPGDGCRVMTASYGGERNVLIRAKRDGDLVITALGVVAGQEEHLSRAFIAEHLPGGVAIGTFGSRQEALLRALEICPGAVAR